MRYNLMQRVLQALKSLPNSHLPGFLRAGYPAGEKYFHGWPQDRARLEAPHEMSFSAWVVLTTIARRSARNGGRSHVCAGDLTRAIRPKGSARILTICSMPWA
jgi:hypothetical protein